METTPIKDDPIIYMGLDLAVKRDSSALAGIYRNKDGDLCLEDCLIWPAPVDIVNQVEPAIFNILRDYRVGAFLYDPYQFATTEQGLIERGFKDLLHEINQQSQMIACTNTLHSECLNTNLKMPHHPDLRAHFAAASAQHTERGMRMIKLKQSRQIDGCVAVAMALWGCVQEVGHTWHPSWDAEEHRRTLFSIP
jgi:phage terminase large subunit-like protein